MATKRTKKLVPQTSLLPTFLRQPLAISITTIAVLLAMSMIASGVFISYLWRQQATDANYNITNLILEAANGLTTPVPVDAPSGIAYIAQARLTLPPKPTTVGVGLEYRYTPAEKDVAEELSIPNGFGMMQYRAEMLSAGNLNETFKIVPSFQACVRGYSLMFAENTTPDRTLRFTKQLTDGRKLFVYVDNGCQALDPDFEAYLKQIDSY